DLSQTFASSHSNKKKYNILVSLSGHLFDKFLINEALDIIEAAGGSFHLIKCQLGQSENDMSYSELEVGADDNAVLDQIIDSLTSIANPNESFGSLKEETNTLSLKIGKIHKNGLEKEFDTKMKPVVLILGAGRVCRPAAEFLASIGSIRSQELLKTCIAADFEENNNIQVIVASLYLQDAEEVHGTYR
ncbi:1-piperideine-2-carboxylate,1-pyrroline-2-carboxylate reductase, partial [Sarracenia purpurea var. burkii]